MYVCEFEFVQDGDFILCWPFWPGRADGTQGEDFNDAVEMAWFTQLCNAGQLDSWKVGRTCMVSLESVELRLAEERRAGRPKKEAVSV